MGKRSPDFGTIAGLSQIFPRGISTELLHRICLSRAFEQEAHTAYDIGLIHPPVYLSRGQEAVAAALSLSFNDDQPDIFAQHRTHDLYLCYGASPEALVDELLGLPTGCAKGMGGSASIHAPEINMYPHDGLMGTQIPIAVGRAIRKQRFGIERKTLAIMGDASAEEDYVLSALGFAATKKLPILFICMDNGLSILTETDVRRNWSVPDVSRAFGIPALDITDDPWLIMHHVNMLKTCLPALLNIQVCRGSSHAGTRSDNYKAPEWDRFALIKNEAENIGLASNLRMIEAKTTEHIRRIWHSRLPGGQK